MRTFAHGEPTILGFWNPYRESAEGAPLLVVLQSDIFDSYPTILVAPLVPAHSGSAPEIRPRFEIGGVRLTLHVLQMAPMPRTEIGPPIAALDRYRVLAAYDALISGSYI